MANGVDDPAEYDKLNPDQQRQLQIWISRTFAPSNRVSTHRNLLRAPLTSYSWKYLFEKDGGFYITNGAFKGAMLAAGYPPTEAKNVNWRFKIKLKRDPGTLISIAKKEIEGDSLKMPDEKDFEVRMIVFAKGAAQAAGKVLIGPNRHNQAFVTEVDEPSGHETIFMLDERGDVKEVKPGEEAPPDDNLDDPNAGAV